MKDSATTASLPPKAWLCAIPSDNNNDKDNDDDMTVRPTTRTAMEILEELPPNKKVAYTTMRTVACRTKLLSLEHHAQRLVDSAHALDMFPAKDNDDNNDNNVFDDQLPIVLAMLRSSARRITRAANPHLLPHQELKLTAWVHDNTKEDNDDGNNNNKNGTTIAMGMHGTAMGNNNNSQRIVRAEVVRASRTHHGATKDRSWIQERTLLPRGLPMDMDCEEQLLVDTDGRVLEGASSNVFVLYFQDGKVVMRTADATEGVLAGTMRQVLLDVCTQQGIPVVLQAPQWQDCMAQKWMACFLTSTSRFVLPVDELYENGKLVWTTTTATATAVENNNNNNNNNNHDDDSSLAILIEKLRRGVLEQVAQRADPFMGDDDDMLEEQDEKLLLQQLSLHSHSLPTVKPQTAAAAASHESE